MLAMTVSNNTGMAASLTAHGRRVQRAMAAALNACAREIREAEKAEMQRVFDRPTQWTLRSLAYTPAKPDALQAALYINKPARMAGHYLVPQITGGRRREKGTERGIGTGERYVPGVGVALDPLGNIKGMAARQIVRALRSGPAGRRAEYVIIPQRKGRLLPGVYRREADASNQISAADRRKLALGRSRALQRGRVATVGGMQFARIVRARRLVPLLIKGRQTQYQPRLDFYGVARRVAAQRLVPLFNATLAQYSAG